MAKLVQDHSWTLRNLDGIFIGVDIQVHAFKRPILLQNVQQSVQGGLNLIILEGQLCESSNLEEGRVEGDVVQRERSQSVGEQSEWIVGWIPSRHAALVFQVQQPEIGHRLGEIREYLYEILECCEFQKLQDFGVLDVGCYQVTEILYDGGRVAKPELQRSRPGPLQGQRHQAHSAGRDQCPISWGGNDGLAPVSAYMSEWNNGIGVGVALEDVLGDTGNDLRR